MESKTCRISRTWLCACYNRRWNTFAVFINREMAGDITHGGRERRRKTRQNSQARGRDEPYSNSEEFVGPKNKTGPTFQQ